MHQSMSFQSHEARRTLLSLAFVPALALLVGCSAAGGGGDSNAGDPSSNPTEELIGGESPDANFFRSTVGVGDVSTAARVGPRLFLPAAHGVAVPRPGRMPVENFPPN